MTLNDTECSIYNPFAAYVERRFTSGLPGYTITGWQSLFRNGKLWIDCIQLYQAGDFIFGYQVLDTKEHFILKNKPYNKGLYLQIILDGDIVLSQTPAERKDPYQYGLCNN